MKKLDFQPAKSKDDFRKNYKLHDLAEYHGKNLFFQCGVEFHDFGKDRRFEKVWEKGKDKPDIIAEYNDKKFLVDWKGKTKNEFWVNKRAIEAYKNWSNELNLPIFICFLVFNNNDRGLKERKFAIIGHHSYSTVNSKAWDKNEVVEFDQNLPKLTKANLIELLM